MSEIVLMSLRFGRPWLHTWGPAKRASGWALQPQGHPCWGALAASPGLSLFGVFQSMWKTKRSTVKGYFLAGGEMVWWPVSSSLRLLRVFCFFLGGGEEAGSVTRACGCRFLVTSTERPGVVADKFLRPTLQDRLPILEAS